MTEGRTATQLSVIITVNDNGYAFGTYEGVFRLKREKEGGWILHDAQGRMIRTWPKGKSKPYVVGVALTAVLRRAGKAIE